MTTVQRAMPLLFVLIWATGFIVARGVAPHAEPLTFLVMRYLLTTAVFTAVAVTVGAAWPKGRAIAYGEKRRIHVSRPVCSEQIFASETLPTLPGENDPALELLICDCPGRSGQAS
jgi:hypothetical protein